MARVHVLVVFLVLCLWGVSAVHQEDASLSGESDGGCDTPTPLCVEPPAPCKPMRKVIYDITEQQECPEQEVEEKEKEEEAGGKEEEVEEEEEAMEQEENPCCTAEKVDLESPPCPEPVGDACHTHGFNEDFGKMADHACPEPPRDTSCCEEKPQEQPMDPTATPVTAPSYSCPVPVKGAPCHTRGFDSNYGTIDVKCPRCKPKHIKVHKRYRWERDPCDPCKMRKVCSTTYENTTSGSPQAEPAPAPKKVVEEEEEEEKPQEQQEKCVSTGLMDETHHPICEPKKKEKEEEDDDDEISCEPCDPCDPCKEQEEEQQEDDDECRDLLCESDTEPQDECVEVETCVKPVEKPKPVDPNNLLAGTLNNATEEQSSQNLLSGTLCHTVKGASGDTYGNCTEVPDLHSACDEDECEEETNCEEVECQEAGDTEECEEPECEPECEAPCRTAPQAVCEACTSSPHLAPEDCCTMCQTIFDVSAKAYANSSHPECGLQRDMIPHDLCSKLTASRRKELEEERKGVEQQLDSVGVLSEEAEELKTKVNKIDVELRKLCEKQKRCRDLKKSIYGFTSLEQSKCHALGCCP